MGKNLIIAGHGKRINGYDPGACANGFTENERVVTLCKIMQKLSPDIIAITDHDVYSYGDVVALAKKHSCDSVTEYHLNSASAGAYGCEVLIKDGYVPDQVDNELLNSLVKLGFYNRGIKKRNDLANMNLCAQAGISYRLVEVAFISNKNDIELFNSKLNEIAKVQVEAILQRKLDEGVKMESIATQAAEEPKKEKKKKSVFGLDAGVYVFRDWAEANQYTGLPVVTAGMLEVIRDKSGIKLTWNTFDGRMFTICIICGNESGWKER